MLSQIKATQAYNYDSLQPDEIRLFRITGDTPNGLAGTLKSTRLKDAPPYFTLSYCWGTEQHIVPIQVDHQVLHVTPSLAAAIQKLEHLAMQDPSDSSTKWLWIDRICINQDNVLERSQQVLVMGSIFSRAIRTLIWLGPEVDRCWPWPLIDQIYAIVQRNNPHPKFIADIAFQLYSDKRHVDLGLPEWGHRSWEELTILLNMPWFTRTWVIQEIVFSHGDPLIIQGNYGYPWHRLGWAASWLRRNGYLRLPQIPNELQNVDTMFCIRQSLAPWRLDALLIATSVKFHATDQRDKIYGLLGLAAECTGPAGVPDALHPDYTLDTAEVYTKVAVFLIEKSKTLTVLTRAGGISGGLLRAQRKHKVESLPSWVPNWCDFAVVGRNVVRSLSWLADSSTNGVSVLGFPHIYNATTGIPSKLSTFSDHTILSVKGLKVDMVCGVFPLHGASGSVKGQAHDSPIIRAWEAVLVFLRTKKAVDNISSYIKTTTAEQHGLCGRTRDQLLTDGSAYLLDQWPGNQSYKEACNQSYLSLLRSLSVGGDPKTYVGLAANYCLERTFLITSHGRMGIGPADSQIGDLITIIYGGGVPYILRAKDRTLSFVGESYIHGLMNGEAIQDLKQNNLVEETFHIQ